jgi:hypothetical protein
MINVEFTKENAIPYDLWGMLRKVWKAGVEFHKLDIASPEPLPIGPTVIGDNVGFSRYA